MIKGQRKCDLKPITYRDSFQIGKSEIGEKAFYAALLKENKINVPKGCVLPKDVCNTIFDQLDFEKLQILGQSILQMVPVEKYIVRSSAVGEDSLSCSWAGCFESIAEVSPAKLTEAIISCGRSLNGRRVQAYAKLNPNALKISELGILIQEYIVADWSGVGFSVNPVNHDRNEMVLEYQKGKSGRVVGGSGDPSLAFMNTTTKSIRALGNKKCPNIKSVFKLIREIQHILGKPVDVEWIVKQNRIYITQARPITTL